MIIKNNKELNLIDKYCFNKKFSSWENTTFKIIDKFANKDKIFIDIGAWIGVMSIYASDSYKQVLSIEPDPKAIERFNNNMSVNDNIKNITLIKKGLSNKNTKVKIGSQTLGNSCTSLLYERSNMKNTDEIETINFSKFLKDNEINLKDVGLIKMDIEGAEILVIPDMIKLLRKNKVPIFISLHRHLLTENEIDMILVYLFNTYEKCYNTRNKIVSKDEIIEKRIACLLFV